MIVLSDSWSGRVHRWTAADHDSGWLFILVGAVFVLAAILPLLVSTRTVQTQEHTAIEHEPVPVEHDPVAAPMPQLYENAQPAAYRRGPTGGDQTSGTADNINTHATG